MREILFRGKRVNGEWKYGNLLVAGAHKDVCYIMEFAEQHYRVETETVGQYTGVKDKNGKMIFEGDIVAFNRDIHKVVFEQRCDSAYFGIVIGNNETWALGGSVQGYMLEVIGNIYDNKETRQ